MRFRKYTSQLNEIAKSKVKNTIYDAMMKKIKASGALNSKKVADANWDMKPEYENALVSGRGRSAKTNSLEDNMAYMLGGIVTAYYPCPRDTQEWKAVPFLTSNRDAMLNDGSFSADEFCNWYQQYVGFSADDSHSYFDCNIASYNNLSQYVGQTTEIPIVNMTTTAQSSNASMSNTQLAQAQQQVEDDVIEQGKEEIAQENGDDITNDELQQGMDDVDDEVMGKGKGKGAPKKKNRWAAFADVEDSPALSNVTIDDEEFANNLANGTSWRNSHLDTVKNSDDKQPVATVENYDVNDMDTLYINFKVMPDMTIKYHQYKYTTHPVHTSGWTSLAIGVKYKKPDGYGSYYYIMTAASLSNVQLGQRKNLDRNYLSAPMYEDYRMFLEDQMTPIEVRDLKDYYYLRGFDYSCIVANNYFGNIPQQYGLQLNDDGESIAKELVPFNVNSRMVLNITDTTYIPDLEEVFRLCGTKPENINNLTWNGYLWTSNAQSIDNYFVMNKNREVEVKRFSDTASAVLFMKFKAAHKIGDLYAMESMKTNTYDTMRKYAISQVKYSWFPYEYFKTNPRRVATQK